MMLLKHSLIPLLQLDLPGNPATDGIWDGGGSGIAILLLVLLVGGLGVALFTIKRYGFIKKPGQGQLKILETRALGGRQFLVVGQFGGDSFLLGVCPGRIEYLTRLENGKTTSFEQVLDHQQSPDPERGNR